MAYIGDTAAIALAVLVVVILIAIVYTRNNRNGSTVRIASGAPVTGSSGPDQGGRQNDGRYRYPRPMPRPIPRPMPRPMPHPSPPHSPPTHPDPEHPEHPGHPEDHKEHFGGGGPDGTAYAGWFDESHRDAQLYMQRGSVRGDGDPDCEDFGDSVRIFDDRIYATAAIDPIIEREAGKYAQQFRTLMMGEDLPPCNCAPEFCACPWGVAAGRRYVAEEGGCPYPEVPGGPLCPEVGVGVGPLEVADCGVPCDYVIPSEPVCWDGQGPGDYYGPEGASVHASDMYMLTEPDHELLH